MVQKGDGRDGVERRQCGREMVETVRKGDGVVQEGDGGREMVCKRETV